MKKFFTLFAAGAVVFSAAAADLKIENSMLRHGNAPVKEITVKKTVSPTMRKVAKQTNINATSVNGQLKTRPAQFTQSEPASKMRKMKMMSARKVGDASSVEGKWTFYFGDYYFESSAGGTITATYESVLTDDGYLVFEESPATGYFLPFVGQYNASNSTISFSREYLADNQGYSIYQQPFEYNYYTQGLDNLTALVGNFNSSNGNLTFTADQGIAWEAYQGNSMAGYYDILDFEGATLAGSGTGGGTGGGNTGGGTSGPGIEGDWTFTYYDALYQSSTMDFVDIQYTCSYDAENDMYWFEDPTNENLPFGVDFNAATNVVTLPAVFIGSTGTYIVSQEPFVVNMMTEDFDFPEELSFLYDPSTGSMVFDEYTGITWGAYDQSYQYLGDFKGYYFEQAVKAGGGNQGGGDNPGTGEDPDWTDIGNATFMDGWVLPLFGVDQNDQSNWYQVPIQQNKTNPNMYRLVNPYMYGPVASYNTHATKKGYIQFDLSDPDHVMFSTVESGFAFADAGITKMYCMNALSFFVGYYGYSPEQIISTMGDAMPYTVYDNGVVDLSYIIDEDGPWYDACFGIQNATTGGYQWQDQQGNTADMNARIYMPDMSGVGAIENANDVKVEYYNLQGVRVLNPVKGQIVIVRKGNEATKTIVR